ncbi:hypothetical protein [Neobacillus drentensis]|uniref:glycoside hydrolase family 38 N-terminal domain-containing protein n=1 Tax=Neobacillus drentensis TaxID=220684 RepID=UPI00300304A4
MHHIYFIKEVIDILNAIHAGETKWEGFKWNCESFWCVEKFLETADQPYIDNFIKYVKSGEIGVSGNYLNMTELIDYTVLNNTIASSVQYMEPYAIQLTTAMTADINGYSWGYADALYENGIKNLMSCIHTHHGYHPLFKKQTPFYWQSPKGNKLLIWNGEHFLIGNELFIADDDVYEWVMDNFWETNFKVDLGGFHQYRYSLLLNNSFNVSEAFQSAKAASCPVLCYYSYV